MCTTTISWLIQRRAKDNTVLHAVLRRDLTYLTPEIASVLDAIRLDVLQAAALMEVLYPVKHAILPLNQI